MKKAGCPAKECLFVGDSLKKDVQGAVDAGLQAVWYCPEYRKKAGEDVSWIADMRQLPEAVLAL